MLTGKPFVFCVGADIDEFPNVDAASARVEGSRAGHELFGRIRALPFPTLAAINGACLGGGVEIALHCDARTIAIARSATSRCPECFLGIFPGLGRHAARAAARRRRRRPSRFVVENPLRQNRMLDGPEAFELGFADGLLEPVEFLDESIAFALELARTPVERQPPDLSRDGGGDPPRPLAARRRRPRRRARAVRRARPDRGRRRAGRSRRATARRRTRSPSCCLGRQAQASLYAFDLVERRAKRKPACPTASRARCEKVGIVGAGLMATQLATLFLRRLEVPLVIRDLDQEIVDGALAEIRRIDDAAARGRMTRTSRLPRADRLRHDRLGRLRGLRPRARGGLRGARREASRSSRELRERRPARTASSRRTPRRSRSPRWAPTSGCTSSTRSRCCRSSSWSARARRDDVTVATAYTVATDAAQAGRRSSKDAPGFVVNRVLTRMTSVLMDALEHGNTVEETDEADPPARHADGAVRPAADGRPAGREPRARDDARGLPRPLPALAHARELRGGQRRDRRRRASSRAPSRRSPTRCSRRSPTRCGTARRGRRRRGGGRRHRAAARRRAGRSAWAGSRSTSTRRASASASPGGR